MTKHGGARPGAGRRYLNGRDPHEGTPAVTATISIPQAMRDTLRDLGNGNVSAGVRRAVETLQQKEKTMQGFYITGTKGSYIELDDGRWADSVHPYPPHDNVEELLTELTDQADGPTFCDYTIDELKKYVGAE